MNPETAPQEGEILAGKYRIEKILGAGGMGVVVAAQHIHLDDKVAIKFLLPDAKSNPEVLARFAREARAAVKIKSEHVARVSDVGTLENGAPYMVMEYLDGTDLSAWVRERGALSFAQATEFVLQASEAIAEAHALGIIHRDLKPANLFVIRRPDGKLSVKVLDFGISKVTGLTASGPDMGLTKTSAVMGSPLYMSPEQMESARNADARSDIWSLGIILYELVAGKAPFDGETMPELLTKVLQRDPPPLRDYRPDAPDGFEPIIRKCLEKNPDARYQNVAELAVALAEFAPKSSRLSVERVSNVLQAAGLSTSALALPPSSEGAAGVRDATTAPWGSTAAPTRSGGFKVLLVGGGAIAIAIVGTVVYLGRRSPPATPAAAPSAVTAETAPASVQPAAAPSVTPAEAPSAEASASAPPAASSAPRVTKPPAKTAWHAKPKAIHHVVRKESAAARVKKTAPPKKTKPAPKGTMPSDVYSDRK